MLGPIEASQAADNMVLFRNAVQQALRRYECFRRHSLVPQPFVLGNDDRGAILRVMGGSNDCATRIKNPHGEPAANQDLYVASQIHAGLDSIRLPMQAPEATHAPYDTDKTQLPSSLSKTLEILNSELALCVDIGTDLMCCFSRVKASEVARYELAEDQDEWQQRKYDSEI